MRNENSACTEDHMATNRWSAMSADRMARNMLSPRWRRGGGRLILTRDLARRVFVAMSDCFWRGAVIAKWSPHGI